MDWTAFGSIAGLVGAGVAMVAFVSQLRLARLSLQADVVLRFNDRMEDDGMRRLRKAAAAKLIAKEPDNEELERLLDFWATVAFMVRSGAINLGFAYDQFGWWMIRYWHCSKEHIARSRAQDPGSFRNLEHVVKSLIRREMRDCYSKNDYSESKLAMFLAQETRL